MTRKGNRPVHLIFSSEKALDCISGKPDIQSKVFKYFDYKGLGKNDATEIYPLIMLTNDGQLHSFIENVVLIFGFQATQKISRDEFFFFVDCLFKGIMVLVNPIGYYSPPFKGKKLA